MTDYERLTKVFEYLNISPNSLSKELGLSSPQVFYDIKKERHGISKKLADLINGKYLNINTSWLLTGNGEMIKQEEKEGTTKRQSISETADGYKLVPLYNMDARGGFGANYEVDCTEYVVDHIPFKDAKDKDICVPVSGKSMMPTFCPGTVVLLHEIENWIEFLETGQIYVLILKDGRRLIKELRRSEEDRQANYLCVSHNPDYEPVELQRKLIHKVYMVTAMYQKTSI